MFMKTDNYMVFSVGIYNISGCNISRLIVSLFSVNLNIAKLYHGEGQYEFNVRGTIYGINHLEGHFLPSSLSSPCFKGPLCLLMVSAGIG